jgi:hypothetical protein
MNVLSEKSVTGLMRRKFLVKKNWQFKDEKYIKEVVGLLISLKKSPHQRSFIIARSI